MDKFFILQSLYDIKALALRINRSDLTASVDFLIEEINKLGGATK